jgi:hypothetical protein
MLFKRIIFCVFSNYVLSRASKFGLNSVIVTTIELYNFIHDVADKLLLQGKFAFKAKTLSAKFELVSSAVWIRFKMTAVIDDLL